MKCCSHTKKKDMHSEEQRNEWFAVQITEMQKRRLRHERKIAECTREIDERSRQYREGYGMLMDEATVKLAAGRAKRAREVTLQTEQSSVGRSDEANKFPHDDGKNNERDDVFHSPIGCQLCCDPATIVPSLDFRNEGVAAFNKTCSRRQNVYNKAGY